MKYLLAWATLPLLAIFLPCYVLFATSPYLPTVNFISRHPQPLPLDGNLAPNNKLHQNIVKLGAG